MHLEDFLVLDNGFVTATSAQKSAREIVSRFFLARYGCKASCVPGDGTIVIAFGYNMLTVVTLPRDSRLRCRGQCD
jgi:hypothetical protein